jgi:hypothetical protein
MAKKQKKQTEPASWAEILGPAGLEGFFNPSDPKVAKRRERAAEKVDREFSKLLSAFHEAEQEKKLRKLVNKLAQSQAEESP